MLVVVIVPAIVFVAVVYFIGIYNSRVAACDPNTVARRSRWAAAAL